MASNRTRSQMTFFTSSGDGTRGTRIQALPFRGRVIFFCKTSVVAAELDPPNCCPLIWLEGSEEARRRYFATARPARRPKQAALVRSYLRNRHEMPFVAEC